MESRSLTFLVLTFKTMQLIHAVTGWARIMQMYVGAGTGLLPVGGKSKVGGRLTKEERMNMKLNGRSLPLALFAAAALACAPAISNATVLEYQLTSDHCTGGCLGGLTSAGTVTVTETATGLNFSVTLATGFTIINTGFDGSFGFNLNPDQVVTYSNLTAGFTPVGGNPVGAQNLTQWDGFGSWEYAVLRNVQGGGNGLPSLSFDLTGTSLLTLASLQRGSGCGDCSLQPFFVVDVRSGTTGLTGLVDASVGTAPSPQKIPEPQSLALLGIGLIGAGFIRRRRAS